MKIELKKVRSIRGDDGPCFEAEIWIDGRKAAWVNNSGNGGPNLYRFTDRELEKKFIEFTRASAPEIEFEAEDTYIDNLMLEIEDLKVIKRKAKAFGKKGYPFVMVYKTQTDNYSYSLNLSALTTKESAERVAASYNVTVPYKIYDATGVVVGEQA